MEYHRLTHPLYRSLMIQAIIEAEYEVISSEKITQEAYLTLYTIFDFDKLKLEEIVEWFVDIYGLEDPQTINRKHVKNKTSLY